METLLEIGLGNAVVAGLLAVLAAAVTRACRRPALVHTLWLLVLVKLVTPSLLVLPLTWPASPAANASPLTGTVEEELSPASRDVAGETATAKVAAAVGRLARSCVPPIQAAWLAGSVLWFTLAGVRIYRFGRLLRLGCPAPQHLQCQAEALAKDLGLAKCPLLWLLPGTLSPMIWGFGNPAWLLLPASLVSRMTPEQLRTLVVHELAHVRRRDPYVRLFELVVLGLYWWYPLAWWARGRLREAEEQCCDAWVVSALPASAPMYATALVETMAFLASSRPALPPAATGVGYVRLLETRLQLILLGTPSKEISLLGLASVMSLGLLALPCRPGWNPPQVPGPEEYCQSLPVADIEFVEQSASPPVSEASPQPVAKQLVPSVQGLAAVRNSRLPARRSVRSQPRPPDVHGPFVSARPRPGQHGSTSGQACGPLKKGKALPEKHKGSQIT